METCPTCGGRYEPKGYADVILNHDESSLSRNGETIRLTRAQFLVTKRLVEGSGKVVFHEELIDSYAKGVTVSRGVLKVHATALNKVLSKVGLRVANQHGLGYYLTKMGD